MKQNPLILPLIGGGTALICFFFPWIKIDFSSLDPTIRSVAIHGIQSVINGATFTVLHFLSTLTILGVCLYMYKQQTPWKARIPVIICSGFGVLYYLISIIWSVILVNPISTKLMENAQIGVNVGNIVSIQIGMYGVLIGFLLAFIGAWKIPKSDISIDENEQSE